MPDAPWQSFPRAICVNHRKPLNVWNGPLFRWECDEEGCEAFSQDNPPAEVLATLSPQDGRMLRNIAYGKSAASEDVKFEREVRTDTGRDLGYSRHPAYDPVKHPSHYTSGHIEVWDFIADQNLNFLLGNVVKYVCRAGKKDENAYLVDLRKAEAYLQREMKRISDNAAHQ